MRSRGEQVGRVGGRRRRAAARRPGTAPPRSAFASDLQSVLAMFTPVTPVPQIADPVLPWTEHSVVDRGTRGSIAVRHTPGIGESGAVPVVLLHGITLTADVNFFALAPLFGPHRPAIVFDLPNHGSGIRVEHFSFDDVADDVVAILDHLGVSQAVVCGYSLGGITAMVVADRHPHRIAGIVVQAAAMRYGVDVRERLFLQTVAAIDRLRLTRATRGLPARYWRASVRRSAHAAARWRWIDRQLAATDDIGFATVWRAVARSDHRDLRCDVPHAVLVLAADRVCPPRLQQEVVDILGGSRFLLDADHDLPVSDPDGYASITDAALRSVSGR